MDAADAEAIRLAAVVDTLRRVLTTIDQCALDVQQASFRVEAALKVAERKLDAVKR